MSSIATSGVVTGLQRDVQTPMGRWGYAIHGARRRPDDPDILLAHGLFIDSAMWRAQIEPLARLGRVVVLDMPGHGRSEVPPPFDLPQHADALAGAMPAMDIRRAVCIGWSWGGSLALHLALRHPDRVSALAVLDTTAEAPTRYRKVKYRLLVEIVRRFGLTPWLARTQIAPTMFSPRSRRERPELVDEFVRSATALPREALIRGALAVAIDAPDILDRLGAVEIPSLVVCGTEDRGYPPEASERMARGIPGAQLRWIEGAGHLSPMERPDDVNRALVSFVSAQLNVNASGPA
ncbi:alpha/beta fold hydrolase [Anaeromyxobacter oryzae]|uniref:alpha/beta fold hydrolase n=1 Tax=Anaeromyxobacter oryzae TaxID=2918170 RepID=UPI0020C17D98|nr:alpha/beta fold hydrolase [Anaeromyxobacter oryzae]